MSTDIPDYAALLALPMTDAERTAIEALVQYGSQNAASEALGWKRTKLQSRLRSVQKRHRAASTTTPNPPVAHGRLRPAPINDLTGGTAAAASPVRRYILTAAQNNTPVHGAFLSNLEAYVKFLGARIMVSRFSYNKAAYGAKAVKAGRHPGEADTSGLWYDPAIEPYVCDDPKRHGSCRWLLAPSGPGRGGLVWCAEMNILPTAVLPLSGLESYSGEASGIFPHAKVALESVPVIGERDPKMNYTTGAVTQRNYIAKKEGLKGEFHHAYGALLVEVDLATGDWWARQLNATDDGAFHDLRNRVADGTVTTGCDVEAINWGDIHASEIDPKVRSCNWGNVDAVIDLLRPRYQFWHDTHSHRSRSHHEAKSFAARAEKFFTGQDADTVEAELTHACSLLRLAQRDWCTTVVVSSNHDRHIERWLDEADYKQDLPNAKFFLEAQLARLQALEVGGGGEWNALEWALTRMGCPNEVLFLGRDQSWVICGPDHPVECGQHGDEGADGARGTTATYAKMAIRMNKGHSHVAMLRNGVASAGVCSRRLAYAHGPSSWSISHVVTYPNGKRAIITMRASGKCWL